MLSNELAKKIKEESSSFFGTEFASIVLYGSYVRGKETKYSDLRNFNPLLLNILRHGIPLLDDGTFATIKDELQRMIESKILEPREDYWVVAAT
jgi:predicted nucleotidyltransferase